MLCLLCRLRRHCCLGCASGQQLIGCNGLHLFAGAPWGRQSDRCIHRSNLNTLDNADIFHLAVGFISVFAEVTRTGLTSELGQA